MKLTRTEARAAGLDPGPAPKARRHERMSDAAFLALCAAHGLPTPFKEFPFHVARKWRFDWLFLSPSKRGVALEIEGLAPGGGPGRHQYVGGFIADMEKYNEAQIAGFVVIRCTWRQVKSGAAFVVVARALGLAGKS